MPTVHKHLKRRLLSPIDIWVAPWICCLKWNGHLDTLTRKKARFLCSDLNAGLPFMSQDIERSESSVETIEKAIGPCTITTRGLTSVSHLKSYAEIKPLILDDVWILLNTNRNSNIPVVFERDTGCPPQLLGVHIALSSLKENVERSHSTIQDSWCFWRNMTFVRPSLISRENIAQVLDANSEKSWEFPLAARWGPI